MKVPEKLGDFRLIHEVGRGGMGVVYEAEQVSLGRRVAVKILPPSFAENRETIERFVSEARAAARLQHRNIVPVYAVGEEGELHYYAMKFIQGRSLGQVLEELRRNSDPIHRTVAPRTRAPSTSDVGAPSATTVVLSRERETYLVWICRLIAEVADGLECAHGNGVVHRDIKPSNIVLDELGVPMLLDFGLARIDRGQKLTQTGEFLGTPAYMSREQILGRAGQIGPRSDVYSLGVTLYELVTLKLPFPGEPQPGQDGPVQAITVIRQILAKEPIAPRKANPRLPRDLETIILTAIDHDVARRYASAADFAADLRRFVAFQPIKARPASAWARARKFARRNPGASIGVAVATLALLALGAVAIGQRVSRSLKIRGEHRLAARSAEAGDFKAAEDAMIRVLAIAPDDDLATTLVDRYRTEGEQARAARAAALKEEEARRAIDRQMAVGMASLDRAAEQFRQAERTRTAPEAEGADRHRRENQRDRALLIEETARRALQDATHQFIEALTLPTADEYRRTEAETVAAATALRLFREAERAGDMATRDFVGDLAVHYNRGRDPEIDWIVGGLGTLSVRCDVPGATASLFEYVEGSDGSPFEYRLVPLPVPPEANGRPLGSGLHPELKGWRLGILDVATQADIEAALTSPVDGPDGAGTDGDRPTVRRPEGWDDVSVFDRCRLPALPLEKLPIAMGSYLVVVRASGFADSRLPVVVHRNESVELAPRMLRVEEVPPGFAYVPGGRSILYGGEKTTFTTEQREEEVGPFLMARREVTVCEYAAFIKDTWASESDQEVARYLPDPKAGVPAWTRLPDGSIDTGIPLGQPVTAITIHGAAAYCAWLSRKLQASIRLPSETEWERAARGADGRPYPWGKWFLPEFCRMKESALGNNELEAAGRFLADCSPFGIFDMAGSVVEFCGPVTLVDGKAQVQQGSVIFARGGSFTSPTKSSCFVTLRLQRSSDDAHRAVGFRVVREL